MTRRLSLSLAVFLGGTAMLAAPTMPAPAADPPKGGTLRISAFSDVDFVDPALAYAAWSWPIGYATCAKLFTYPDAPGAEGTKVIPEVVRTYKVSRDGRAYTFDLNTRFRFHTGAPVTAQSFVDAFNRDANPKQRSPATGFIQEIVGARAVIDGTATSISGVQALARHRLQIRLTRPVGDFIARLTLPFFCPVLANTPIEPGGINDPPGSGPYYVAERIVNQRIVLERNPFYRGDRPANVDKVIWTVGESREGCLLSVEQDRIDYCDTFGVPPNAYRPLGEKYGINRPGGQFFVSPSLQTWFFLFNHERPAFGGAAQIPLKKAINYAIDRPALARVFGYLGGTRTDQLLPPAIARRASIYPHEGADPSTARSWLGKAWLKPRRLVFYTANRPLSVAIAQILEFNLKQIGIDLDVKYFDPVVLHEKLQTRGEPFDIGMMGFSADYADGAGFFVPILSPAGANNGVHLDDPRLYARMAAVGRLTGEARRKAWADLDVDLMRDNPPYAPFVNVQNRAFVSRSLGCYLDHPVYGFDIAAVCKKQ